MATSMEIALRPVVQQIESHRATRSHSRAPFPAAVWQKLSRLAQVYGISKVAKHAGVCPTTLTAHVRRETGETDFIECVVAGESALPVATIEIESHLGERMRIQASSLKISDLSLLLRDFLGR